MFEKLVEQINSRIAFKPEIAIILGTGLGKFAENIDVIYELKYSDINGMPVSTAPSHEGRFVFGTIEGKNVVAMQGRVHLYEGYTPQQVVMPIRIMRALGAEKLIVTNAAGGINKNLNVGDFMMISDQISSFVPSPLIGKNDDTIGTRFPDMSNAYDKKLQALIKSTASELNIPIKSGVYAQLSGPQFETPAEIKMLSAIGADAVGMSTAIETIAAVHCGFKVCGISLISNLACGILDRPLSEEEVGDTASSVSERFEALIKGIIRNI
ncbi:MAG: purine-nucleoside phosphorylase [Eubacterium sp.]|nr:purine-nucleoside phosphorylase [Eubacterium sp.]